MGLLEREGDFFCSLLALFAGFLTGLAERETDRDFLSSLALLLLLPLLKLLFGLFWFQLLLKLPLLLLLFGRLVLLLL